MKLDGGIEIAAPMADVWKLIVDPIGLSACVPGVSDVRQVDDRTFEGSISAAVGPVEGQFSFRSVLARASFPDDLAVEVEGVDSVTNSRLIATVEVALTERGTSATALAYRATVTVKGRLAIVGEMILRATASQMITQVTRCLRSRLEPTRAGAAASVDSTGPGRAPGTPSG